MLRMFAILVGIAFIFAGIAGYLPIFTQDGLLFGFFEVNSMHNIVHLITGVLAIMAAATHSATKLLFSLFGLVYAAIGIFGFWSGGDLGIMHVNTSDNIFHIVFGVIAMYLGFSAKKQTY